MTYYELCQKYAQRFLDNSDDPQTLVEQFTNIITTKRKDTEYDAKVHVTHKHLLDM